MFDTRTLRGRLTLAYAAALVLALAAFAIVALFALDTLQRRLLDRELIAVANAEAATFELPNERDPLDPPTRAHFTSAAGRRVASAVFGVRDRVLLSSVAAVPRAIATYAGSGEAAGFANVSDGNETLRAAFVPLTNAGARSATIAAWSDVAGIERLDKTLALAFAIAIPFVAGLAVLAGGEIARRGLAPLERIVADASEIEAHDARARVTLPATLELHRLATTLNRMLDRLNAAFARERQFTSDASHELRAPISIILAEADLALASDRTPAEYRRALETIALEADALESLTRDLLATARATAMGDAPIESIDLNEIAASVADRVRPLAAQRQVHIVTVPADDATTRAVHDELERAVLTIVHNAIAFSPSQSTIELNVDVDADRVRLSVSDEGPGFSRAALERGLDRFWRDAAAAPGGHGLGLAIVRGIVERAGGTIALSNRESGGAVVTLRFARFS